MTAVFAPQPPVFVRPAAAPSVEAGVAPRVHHRESAEVYRRRRLVVVMLIVGLFVVGASFARQAEATPIPGRADTEAVVVVVQPGDTLWGIARALDPEHDPRRLVDSLRDLAGSAPLQPGQQIIVPSRLLG